MRIEWRHLLGFSLPTILAATSFAAPVVLNASFEDNAGTPYGPVNNWAQIPNPSGLGGFQYLSGTSTSSQFPWDNGTVPGEGTSGQVGFIQVFPGVPTLALDQTVAGFVVGQTYTLTYDENSRSATSTPSVEVLVGGVPVVLPHLDPAVGGTNLFRVVTSLPFVATATSEVVELRASQVGPGDDATATFDNVSIAPEPASLGVLALAGIGLSMRRRRA